MYDINEIEAARDMSEYRSTNYTTGQSPNEVKFGITLGTLDKQPKANILIGKKVAEQLGIVKGSKVSIRVTNRLVVIQPERDGHYMVREATTGRNDRLKIAFTCFKGSPCPVKTKKALRVAKHQFAGDRMVVGWPV